jgi:tripartite-type tricarboxylate transporter receptor subunit TctC
MNTITRRNLLVSSLGAAVLTPATAYAQSFPTKPVTMVVPFGAGGPTDVASRVIAAQMQSVLGVNVIIENKPGASTILGAQYVAAAAPDGHTIFMVTTTTLCTNPHLYKKLPYKVGDFAPIAMAVKVPLGLAVRSSLPVSTIAEFRDYVQARPGKMNYGSAGTGSNGHLVNVLMNQALNINMTEVPYKGTAPAMADLAGGHVDALVDAMATSMPLHRDGKIKILGNFDDVRSSLAPDVPTFSESGYPNLVAFTWMAVVAPARVPEAVIAKLNKAVMAAVLSPQTTSKFAEMGFIPQTSSARQLAVYIQSENDRWGPLIKKMGIQLD